MYLPSSGIGLDFTLLKSIGEEIVSGLVFLKTRDITGITDFYAKRIGMDIWLDQGGCVIFQKGNLLLGFCQREQVDSSGIITFFYTTRQEVDAMYAVMRESALELPKLNPVYRIYHFFARDPEGRTLEFQHFEHELKPFVTLEEGLMRRRSIRSYRPDPVPEEVLTGVFELCRYSPTARNLQAYYYIVVRDRARLEQIVKLRGPAGNPILAAPLAIAVGASGSLARRVVQDACIAAYHLLLAAKAYGLGTCWVTDMDTPEVKALLEVPSEDYIACLTPLGYAVEEPPLPQRHEVQSFVRQIP